MGSGFLDTYPPTLWIRDGQSPMGRSRSSNRRSSRGGPAADLVLVHFDRLDRCRIGPSYVSRQSGTEKISCVTITTESKMVLDSRGSCVCGGYLRVAD